MNKTTSLRQEESRCEVVSFDEVTLYLGMGYTGGATFPMPDLSPTKAYG